MEKQVKPVRAGRPPSGLEALLQQAGPGTNKDGMRLANERLILSLLRSHRELPKAEIARITGLSAQTITVIMKRLDKAGLTRKLAPVRGKVGQPSVPMALNPDGAFTIGMKIGRRSANLLLVDFTGRIRAKERLGYTYPDPKRILKFAKDKLPRLVDALQKRRRSRLIGMGVAYPFEIWNWHREVGAGEAELQAWRDFDLKAALEEIAPCPVMICNDGTAACSAELVLGDGSGYDGFLHIFIGYFIGGGMVLDGVLLNGRNGNVGAVGSMPIGRAGSDPQGTQLIQHASLHCLETAFAGDQKRLDLLKRPDEDWQAMGHDLSKWIARAAIVLAPAIVSAASLLDLEAVFIDGAFPDEIRTELCKAVRAETETLDLRGVSPFGIREGTIGFEGRALGGACLPFLSTFGHA